MTLSLWQNERQGALQCGRNIGEQRKFWPTHNSELQGGNGNTTGIQGGQRGDLFVFRVHINGEIRTVPTKQIRKNAATCNIVNKTRNVGETKISTQNGEQKKVAWLRMEEPTSYSQCQLFTCKGAPTTMMTHITAQKSTCYCTGNAWRWSCQSRSTENPKSRLQAAIWPTVSQIKMHTKGLILLMPHWRQFLQRVLVTPVLAGE